MGTFVCVTVKTELGLLLCQKMFSLGVNPVAVAAAFCCLEMSGSVPRGESPTFMAIGAWIGSRGSVIFRGIINQRGISLFGMR